MKSLFLTAIKRCLNSSLIFLQEFQKKIISTKPVSGGDISSAYLIESEARKYFLKVNSNLCALEMFHAEQKGLQTIEQTKTIAVPHVHLADTIEGKAFLLMDFIESKRPPDMSDYIRFGEVLAELHHCSQKDFGFSTDNFIGSLPQRNNTHAGWAEFYWFERILPQLQSALKAGLIQQNIIPKEKDVIPLFQEIFGDVKPSLLHGDLWGRKLPHFNQWCPPLPYRSCCLLWPFHGRYCHERPLRWFRDRILQRISRNHP